MARTKVDHPSAEARRAEGRKARKLVSRTSHGDWTPSPDRPDPVALLAEQNARREPDLVPVRHGRMMVSPFTFYRGAARVMAADLGTHPAVGVDGADLRRRSSVQLRLLRLSGTRSRLRPERLRRNATRPVGVGRQAHGGQLHDRGSTSRIHFQRDRRSAPVRASRATGRPWRGSPACGTLDVWYSHQSAQDLLDSASGLVRKGAQKVIEKARMHDSLQALSKLAVEVDGEFKIASAPPIVVPLRDMPTELLPDDIQSIDRRPVPLVPFHAAARSTSAPGAVQGGRLRAQGGGGRERRHAGVHRAPRRTGPR